MRRSGEHEPVVNRENSQSRSELRRSFVERGEGRKVSFCVRRTGGRAAEEKGGGLAEEGCGGRSPQWKKFVLFKVFPPVKDICSGREGGEGGSATGRAVEGEQRKEETHCQRIFIHRRAGMGDGAVQQSCEEQETGRKGGLTSIRGVYNIARGQQVKGVGSREEKRSAADFWLEAEGERSEESGGNRAQALSHTCWRAAASSRTRAIVISPLSLQQQHRWQTVCMSSSSVQHI